MSEVRNGRWTADLTSAAADGMVLFLIGMRINKPWQVRRWFAVVRAMSGMQRYLARHPEAGMISAHNWFGRTTIQVAYWRSVEDLLAFASDNNGPHAPAWRRFNKAVGDSGDVGVWHETHLIRPGSVEGVYVNMPAFGLGGATGPVPVGAATHSARKRLGLRRERVS